MGEEDRQMKRTRGDEVNQAKKGRFGKIKIRCKDKR